MAVFWGPVRGLAREVRSMCSTNRLKSCSTKSEICQNRVILQGFMTTCGDPWRDAVTVCRVRIAK